MRRIKRKRIKKCVQSSKRQFECGCGKIYKSADALHIHKKHKHSGKEYKCNICNSVLSTPGSLKMHTSLHLGQKEFVCKVCGKEFLYNTSLTDHMRIHTGDVIKCEWPDCDRVFYRRTHMKDHFMSAHREPSFSCKKCSNVYRRKSALTVHMKECGVFKPPVRRLCDNCGSAFRTMGELKQHMQMHQSPSHICNVCGKLFHWRSSLRHHLKAHQKKTVEVAKECDDPEECDDTKECDDPEECDDTKECNDTT